MCTTLTTITMHDKIENKTQLDMLLRSCDIEELDSSLWSDKCDYMELNCCKDLNPNNYNLIVMQLNIRSLLSHQLELRQLICSVENKNSRIDIILLCETFLSKQTLNIVNVPGFIHVGNYRKNKKEGGVSILVREGVSYKR